MFLALLQQLLISMQVTQWCLPSSLPGLVCGSLSTILNLLSSWWHDFLCLFPAYQIQPADSPVEEFLPTSPDSQFPAMTTRFCLPAVNYLWPGENAGPEQEHAYAKFILIILFLLTWNPNLTGHLLFVLFLPNLAILLRSRIPTSLDWAIEK